MRRGAPPSRERGVALLMAVLLVALGTILATGIAFQNAMTARRGTASFAFDQSLAVAQAAEALAAYALRQDLRDSQTADFAAENWGQPLGPVEVIPGVALEAKLDDAQGRFNLNSLVGPNGVKDEVAMAEFTRLLELLELEPKWASLIVDWIDRDHEPDGFEGAEDNVYTSQAPPYRTPDMLISSASELLALPGFGRERYLRLAPYVTALPQDAKVNLCTASGVVLDAMMAVPNSPGGQAEFSTSPETLEKNRGGKCFPEKDAEFKAAVPNESWQAIQNKVAQTSSYFRLTSVVTVGNTQFALYSLLYRDQQGMVRPIMRSFSAD